MNSNVEARLAAVRADMISSVFTHGLLSGQQLAAKGIKHLISQDNMANDRVYWSSVATRFDRDRDLEFYRFVVQVGLYRGVLGVFPVMTERAYGDDLGVSSLSKAQTPESTLFNEKRVGASILIVFTEPLVPDLVPTENFLAVFLPRPLVEEYRQIRGDLKTAIPVVEVGDIAASLSRDGFWHKLRVPNYEDALVELIVGEAKRPIACSALRLPINEEDLSSLHLI